MNHTAHTNAVRASLILAPTPAERREESGHRLAPAANAPSHAHRATEADWNSRPGGPTQIECMCEPYGPDLHGHYGLVEDPGCRLHGWDREPVARVIPGTRRLA